MSINEDPFGNMLDVATTVIVGLDPGILKVNGDGALGDVTLGSNLTYTDPTLNLNTIVTGLTSLTSTTLNADTLNITNISELGDIHLSGYIEYLSSTLRFRSNALSNFTYDFSDTALSLQNGPDRMQTDKDTLLLGTLRGYNWSFQNPNLTTTITEIGSGTQTTNRILFDSATNGVSSIEVSDTRSLTHRGVIQYDHATDIWSISTVNNTQRLNISTTINAASNILPTTTFARDIGSTTLKFANSHMQQLNLYNNTSTGTTLQNKLNVNGPSWSTSLDYGISIGCPYSSSPFHTAQESRINQFSTAGGSFAVSIGNVERNTAGVIIADYSKNIIAGYGKLGINHPSTSVPAFSLDVYGLDTSLMRISNSSSQDCLRLTQSGTNTILSVNSTLAGSNNAYIDMCSNVANTPCARLQAFNSSTTTAGLLRFSVQNNTGVLAALYDFDFVRFKPVTNNALDLGQTSLIWRDTYTARLFNDTANLALGCSSATQLNLTSTSLSPQTTNTLSLGTTSLRFTAVNTAALQSPLDTLNFNVNNANRLILTNSTNALHPTASGGLSLGTASLPFSSVNANTYSSPAVQTLSGGTYQRLTGTKGTQLQNYTTVNKNAITTPDLGAIVYDSTLNVPSIYNGSAWINMPTAQQKTYILLPASTFNTTSTTGQDIPGGTIAFTAQTTRVLMRIEGGLWFNPQVVGASSFLGISATAGAQSYALWNLPMFNYNDTSALSETYAACNFSLVITGLTIGVAYTYYLKFGSNNVGSNAILYSGTSTVGVDVSRTVLSYEFI